jgi:hypothetical protein
MTPGEIAAYIGAAAWLPHIGSWLYRNYVVSSIRLIPNQSGEVGFTNLGPILNFRMAFFVEKKDIVIDGMELSVRHADGDSRVLRWAGLAERLSQIVDASGTRQTVERDDFPIAIRLSAQGLVEKFVRFQEPRFHETIRPIRRTLGAHFNHLKETAPDGYIEECLRSKEMAALHSAHENAFWWKPGRYDVAVVLTSPQSFELQDPTFAFELSTEDVAYLRANLALARAQIENLVRSTKPGFNAQSLPWNWADVELRKKS